MPANRAQFHFDQGLNFIQKGDYEKAATYFKEAILEEPQFHEALYNLACCQAVIGDKDNALIYLSRAVKLNMHCMDWAMEDREFDSVRDDPLFKKVVNPESVGEEESFGPAVVPNGEAEGGEGDSGGEKESREEGEEEGKPSSSGQKHLKEEMPNLRDDKEIIEDLPPCAHCGGILHTEKRTQSSPKQLAFILALGIILCLLMFYTIFGVAGFFVIAYGLYSLTRINTVWVCNSCGSDGETCGQTKDRITVEQAQKLQDLEAKK